MGLINFAHGELIMVGAYTILLIGQPRWPVVVIATIVVAIVFALAMERVAFRPLRSANPTDAADRIVRGQLRVAEPAILIEGSAPQGTSVSTWLSESVQIGSVTIPKLDVVTIGVTLVLLVALGLFLQRTRMGVQMRAAAEDFQMARILGVKANTVIAIGVRDERPAGRDRRVPARRANRRGRARHRQQPGARTRSSRRSSEAWAVCAGLCSGAMCSGRSSSALQAYLPLELRSYRDAFAFAVVIVCCSSVPQGLIVARSTATRV